MDPRAEALSLSCESLRDRSRVVLAELAQLDKSDFKSALRRIIESDAEVLCVGRVSYWELSPDHSAIDCRVLYERGADRFTEGGQLRAQDFPRYFHALLESRVIVAHDAWNDARTMEFVDAYFRPNDIRSMLDVPVWRRGKLAGVLCHEHLHNARAWSSDEQSFALGIANMVSIVLEGEDRRHAQEGYELVARATHDVLWDWNIKADVIEWNEALLAVFRYHEDEVQPSWRWWCERIHPDDAKRVEGTITEAMQLRHMSWSEQYRWRRGDGSYATVIDRGHLVCDSQGSPVRMVGSMLDITDRVAMQARLALSDRMASIGVLAAGVAHEINNPLTYIMANLTCALEDLRAGVANVSAVTGLLREAQDGAERVRSIVRDLQVFSRPREDELDDLDVRGVIESAINMAWHEIKHRAQLVKDYSPTPRVRMNGARLGQVVLNLLVNAAHAIQEGNARENQIRVRLSSSAGHVVIEVQDSGRGIAPENVPHIFEPFFTTKAIGVGTGLGLSICHSIVVAAGGRIEVESPATGGCLMRVVLPHGARDAIRRPGAPRPEVARRRILVIDDELPLRRAIGRMLERHHAVVVADSGETALEHIRRGEDYDVILCDLMMPRMTGMDLYACLLSEYAHLAPRMVFMTGGAFTPRSSDFLADCERPYLEKPVTCQQLDDAIARVGP